MRSWRRLFSAFGLLLLTAVDLTVGALPDRPSGYVTDDAGVLPAETRQRIESILTQLEAKTSAEVAVVTVSSLGGRDVESFATDLFRRWGIGKKDKNNGVLFLVAPNDRRMRVEVGYGLEGVLPDGKVGRLLDTYVVPAFKSGDLPSGIEAGTAALATEIARDAGVDLAGAEPRAPPAPQQEISGAQKFFLFLVLGLIAFFAIRHPFLFWALLMSAGRGNSRNSGGGGFGGGFGGFGGGSSGGGGASRGW